MQTRQFPSRADSFRLRHTLRLAAALTCVAVGVDLTAQSAGGDSTSSTVASAHGSGQIEGRVFNASSGMFVNNARVTVEGTNIETYSDEGGSYRLRGVPAGPHRITVRFTGQDPVTQSVTVRGQQPTKANFSFGTTDESAEGTEVVLDPFEVKASHFRNQIEIALNEERSSVNIKSVVATDSLGYVADGNVGDFVRFLPGVDIGYGDGTAANPDNAVSVGVRGFGSANTAILVDGVPIASGSPSGLGRTVQLDGLSVNNISRLEIIKVATPDMPQDSPGGAINLVSRSAFELPKSSYSLSTAFNFNTNDYELLKKSPGPNNEMIWKTQPNIRFNGTIPLSEKLGVVFSVASDNKYSLTQYSRMRDWRMSERMTDASGTDQPVANANGGIRIDNPTLERFELKEYQWLEHRLSGMAGVDWRPFDGLDIKLRGNFNTFENTGVTYRSQWRYKNSEGIADWGPDYVTGFQRTDSFNPNLSGGITVDSRDKEGFTTQGTLTAKYRKNGWRVTGQVSASESYSTFVDRKNGHFSSVDVSLSPGRMDLAGIKDGLVGEILLWDRDGNPLDYGDLSNWNSFTKEGGEARSSAQSTRDLYKQFKFDVEKDLDFLPFPVTVKTGVLQKEKDQHRFGLGTGYKMLYVGPEVPNSELMTGYSTESGLGYAQPQFWPDPSKIYALFEANPEYFDDAAFSPEYNRDYRAINYESKVNNNKGLTITNTDVYGMVTAKLLNNRLTLIAGARQSHKSTKGYNVFNNPKFNYVLMPDGTIYRDEVYPAGVKYDGTLNPGGAPADAVMTDQALRDRMTAAGVAYLPTQLELSPNGLNKGERNNNYHLAQIARTTREVDSSLKQPWTPQLQAAYDITDELRAQVSWSRETRLPDLEGSNGILTNGSSFQVSEAEEPDGSLGGDGSITVANLTGEPEINTSYNVKLAYYPKNGMGRYSISYFYKVVDNAWETIETYNTDDMYESLLNGMGLDSESYENYRISTVTVTGMKQIRRGFEIEANQNMGIFGEWGRAFDIYANYTHRPVTTASDREVLGFINRVPLRAAWGGGVSFSARRFTAQARMTWVEKGETYNGSGNSVTLPDGTDGRVQFYDLNDYPPELKVDVSYALSERLTLFANGNKVLSGDRFRRIADAQTGWQPDYASYREMTSRGVTWTAGMRASF